MEDTNKKREFWKKISELTNREYDGRKEYDLFCIRHFVENEEAFTGGMINVNMISNQDSMREMSWDIIMKVSDQEFSTYYEAVEQHYKLLHAIRSYKEYHN